MNNTDWTPDRIKQLRTARGQSQTAFGLELYATTPSAAQSRASEMERGERQPSASVVRTLQRMDEGEI